MATVEVELNGQHIVALLEYIQYATRDKTKRRRKEQTTHIEKIRRRAPLQLLLKDRF